MPNLPSAVDQLADAFWDRFLELSPLTATMNGEDLYDDRLPDPGPEGRARSRDLAIEVRDAALAIPEDGLSVEDRITRDMLAVVGELFVEADDLRLDTLQAVDHSHSQRFRVRRSLQLRANACHHGERIQLQYTCQT